MNILRLMIVGIVFLGFGMVSEAAVLPDQITTKTQAYIAPQGAALIRLSSDPNFFSSGVKNVEVATTSVTALFAQINELKELLKASSGTTTIKVSKPAIKTKSYLDKSYGVTLRYPASMPVKVVPVGGKEFASIKNYIKLYEFKNNNSDIPALAYVAVGGDMGDVFWSFFEEGISQGLSEGLEMEIDKQRGAQISKSSKSSFLLQEKVVIHAGHELKHIYLERDGRTVIGFYSGGLSLSGGAFIGVASAYTNMPVADKEKKFVQSDQVAKDVVVTILDKSTLDAKKISKKFGQ